jgi:hypothetical protein
LKGLLEVLDEMCLVLFTLLEIDNKFKGCSEGEGYYDDYQYLREVNDVVLMLNEFQTGKHGVTKINVIQLFIMIAECVMTVETLSVQRDRDREIERERENSNRYHNVFKLFGAALYYSRNLQETLQYWLERQNDNQQVLDFYVKLVNLLQNQMHSMTIEKEFLYIVKVMFYTNEESVKRLYALSTKLPELLFNIIRIHSQEVSTIADPIDEALPSVSVRQQEKETETERETETHLRMMITSAQALGLIRRVMKFHKKISSQVKLYMDIIRTHMSNKYVYTAFIELLCGYLGYAHRWSYSDAFGDEHDVFYPAK